LPSGEIGSIAGSVCSATRKTTFEAIWVEILEQKMLIVSFSVLATGMWGNSAGKDGSFKWRCFYFGHFLEDRRLIDKRFCVEVP
jgi:hypothetical protein